MGHPLGEGLGDILGGVFGQAAREQAAGRVASKKTEKGIPWEAKVIDGQYYIPLRQVAELLEQNDILPAVRAGIERRVTEGAPE